MDYQKPSNERQTCHLRNLMAKTPPGIRSKESHCHLRQRQSDHHEGCSLGHRNRLCAVKAFETSELQCSSQEAGSWARSQLACPKSSRDSGSIWLNCFVSESLKVTVTHQQSKEAKYSLGFVLAGATASD